LDTHVNAENVIGNSLTGCNNEDFATCQDFLLHELAKTLAGCQVEYINPVLESNKTNNYNNGRNEITGKKRTPWQLRDNDDESEKESENESEQQYNYKVSFRN